MSRRAQRLIFGLYLLLAVVATVQRGVLTDRHATFPIFRQSFVHLSTGADLYATYPAEQGTEDRDRFKYSPTAALFFAPFAFLPLVAGLALWTVLNVVALHAAVRALFPPRDGPWALLIVFPALIAAVQSTSSNALVAALMIATFLALERRNAVGAASAMAAGTLMKLYPATAAAFVLTHPRRWRAMAVCAGVFAGFVLAPLLVVSPAELAAQYRSWFAILAADGRDLTFARSIMVVVRGATGTEIPNLAFQTVAGAILIAPTLLRPAALRDAGFRRKLLASILIFVVIFNHQAENASYVIAAVGLAIWFLSSPRTPARIALLLLCLAGLEAVPFALVWLWIQVDLLDDRLIATMRGRAAAWWPAWDAARGAERAPALRRLGVVAGAAGVALLSLSPRVRPVVPLKPATLPDAAAARVAARVTAQAERERPAGRRPARRGVRGTGENATQGLMREATFSLSGPAAIDPSPAGRAPAGLNPFGFVRPADANRADGTGTRTGAAVNAGPSATVDAGESCAVDTLGAAVPEAWKATRVGAVRIESGSIDLPNARLASVARRLHVTTRPDVVRRQLGFRTGDAVDPRRILESVRRLRESALFSDVILAGRQCAGAGTTDLSLRTNDAWTTRGSIRLGGRAPVQALLLERNILGSGRTISLGSQESNGHQAFSFGLADPRFLGADVNASALVRLHGDGREWAWSLRSNDRSVLDPWSSAVTSSQVRRYRVDPRKQVVTDITRRASALTVTRRVASSDAGVWAVTTGVEQELTDLDVTRAPAGLVGSRAHRSFVAPLLGVSRRSTSYRAIDWLVPGQRASEMRVGVEGDFVAGFGREVRTGGPVTHWDGWLGATTMPSSGTVITGDLWTSGYRVRDSIQNASVRASATFFGRAHRGTWVGRLAGERVWSPDPDVFALSTADPMLRTLSPTSRLAAQALSAQVERRAPLYAQDGRWALDGALFAAWSERRHTLDVAGNPVRVMQAAMVGVGLRQVRDDPRQSPLSVDIGRTILSSRGLPNRWIVTLTASPSLGGVRVRDGVRTPTR